MDDFDKTELIAAPDRSKDTMPVDRDDSSHVSSFMPGFKIEAGAIAEMYAEAAPAIRNADNEVLFPWNGTGSTYSADGTGAVEHPAFVATRHELEALLGVWTFTCLNRDWRWFVSHSTSGDEIRLRQYAERRAARIARVIGKKAAQRVIAAFMLLHRDRQDPQLWSLFREGVRGQREVTALQGLDAPAGLDNGESIYDAGSTPDATQSESEIPNSNGSGPTIAGVDEANVGGALECEGEGPESSDLSHQQFGKTPPAEPRETI
jgi:hypothetical protein